MSPKKSILGKLIVCVSAVFVNNTTYLNNF